MMQTALHWLGKIGQSLFVLWAAFTMAFVILYGLPSDPVTLMLSQGGAAGTVDQGAVDAVRSQYGFDQPLLTQYVDKLAAFLRGDFGTSIEQHQPVMAIIGRSIGSTLTLAVIAWVVSIVLGLGLAVAASATRAPSLRQALQSVPPLVLSLPVFWLGLVLLQIFSFTLHWFPSFGDKTPASLILPVIALAIPVSAGFAQVLTKSFLTTWRQPFVQVARAKGLDRRRTLARHVVRNAVIPGLTLAALALGHLLAGTVIVETVFNRAGLGKATQQAVQQQDIPVVMVVVVFAALVFVVVNLLTDALYPLIDPRIRRPEAVPA